MKPRFLLISLLLAAATTAALGQNVSDLIISEAMPLNTDGMVDGYGRHTSWIELTNTSQGTVNFAGCYLTDDPSDPCKYMIPKGDASTRLGPRQTVLFWCGGNPGEGTYYTSFTLEPGETVYLVSNDGKTIIDSIPIPGDIPENMSVSKFAHDNKEMVFETFSDPVTPSPGMINRSGEQESGSQRVARTDPHGWILTLTSVSVVFGALIILWVLFSMTGKLFTREKKAPAPKAAAALPCDDGATAAAIAMALDLEQDGGTYAAIAAALHLYLGEGIHDSESYIITIRPREARHTNFRKLPRKHGTV